ncbi:thioesterase [Mucilaginibacter sp. PPCGB 2223]|uniref:acyl-CoA thioesterase n=1 Tax=Mucilaginibacter sp. PPCGB 2223 TaxID=1886027 RepID=UPI00082499B8|nr:acyl-CoA thioesterase [Mucilaginibacter sp. PPCGB 2223]OCX54819.1 thioesterase [Mucilaginibacter sp. PPCGB 2223]
MKKILTSVRKVRFQDCDPFNHLNNAKYIDYFINAREDQLLENYGLDIFEIANKQGLSWVVASNQICYLKPALTMESVLIESQLIVHSPKSLMVEMRMWDEQQTALKAILWTNFIHVDLKTQRPVNHSPEFSQLFADIVSPIEQSSFDERKMYLLRQRKGEK